MKLKFTADDLNRGVLVDAGEWYPVEISGYQAANAKTDNSKLDKFTFKILTGKFKDAKLYGQFSEKAPGFAIPFIEAITGMKVTEGMEAELDHRLVGKQLEVYVVRGEYKNKPTNEVKEYRPIQKVA